MRILNDFVRVSPRRRCPVCTKPDWCLVDREDPNDPAMVICSRVESDHRWGDAGWFHQLRDRPRWTPRTRSYSIALSTSTNWAARSRQFEADLDDGELVDLAHHLGVTTSSLRRLGIGWSGWAWTFPMRNGEARICGIRVRRPDGSKLCIKGSRQGLFIPKGLHDSDTLLLPEGPTDTAALLDIGMSAVGRPNCSAGRRLLSAYIRRRRLKLVAVVADNDAQGIAGAQSCAQGLAAYTRDVRVIHPPNEINDARAWRIAGATKGDIEEAVQAAERLRCQLIVTGGAR